MILIVSFEDNEHVRQVRRHLTAPHALVDTSWFPATLRMSAKFCRSCDRRALTLPTGEKLDLADVGAVWYRRIRPLGLHEELVDETSRLFAWSESNEALLGLWYSLECYWMNPPQADEVSQRKLRQLQVARRLKLAIPETLITNDPDAARDFVRAHAPGQVVRKAFRNIPQAPRETKIVAIEDLDRIDSVRYAPVIFQRYVPAEMDLRVTVIGDDIFAAAVYSEPAYAADYRLGLGTARVVPYELPDDVAAKLMALMREFGLEYGAVDFRVTPAGEHVFLEVNPAGEYLFISERTGQPIPAAIAATLQRRDRISPRVRSDCADALVAGAS